MSWMSIWEGILDIIYPTTIKCAICNNKRDDLGAYGICELCESCLPFIMSPTCSKCGKPMLDNNAVCSNCDDIDWAFSKGISIFEFNTQVKGLIHRYKYGGQKYLSEAMTGWMANGLDGRQWDFDMIIPVPLHSTRQRQRGFNQSALLARGISKEIGVPVAENILVRIKNTPHQTRLNRYERQQNLVGAFQVNDIDKNFKFIKNKSILLVDDVYTTGSTAHQCSKILLQNGAKIIYIITLAIGTDF